MNQQLRGGRVLRRIGDVALGPAAALLGVLLLGGAVVHLLAPESAPVVAWQPPLVTPAAGIARSARVPAGSVTAATPATPAARFRLVRNEVRPRSPVSTGHHSRPAVLRGAPVRHASTGAARTGRPAPLAVQVRHIVTTPGRLPHSLATRGRLPPHALASRERLPHALAARARLLHALPTRGRLPSALATRARPPNAGSPAVAPVPFPARATKRIGQIARRSRTPQHASQLKAPTPPLGYDPRPVLARVPVAGLPALPIATTPVRGKMPSARSAAVVLGSP